jgi:hypothetical protein
MKIIAFQTELRPELPNIYGVKDYREFRDILIKMDEVLQASGMEHELINKQLAVLSQDQVSQLHDGKGEQYQYSLHRYALRCCIGRHLFGDSYRQFSLRLNDSTLLQWFTGVNEFSPTKATSKSTMERYEKLFDESTFRNALSECLAHFKDDAVAHKVGLSSAVEFDAAWCDMTCIKANIHFPVDWVLMRDAGRSLILSIQQIRKYDLKHRMPEPSSFLKQMNRLCIQMTHTRRKKDGKKVRKAILRDMKRLSIAISKHAKRYRCKLQVQWHMTELSEAQKDQIIKRIDNIINQLPAAIKQAHDRIIGERHIPTGEKLISLYDHSAQVIVRGKAGNEVEFGQKLFLTEQKDGLIIDWELQGKDSKQDAIMLKPIISRIQKTYGTKAISTDRAFNSKANSEFLDKQSVYDATCPRNPNVLKERMADPSFMQYQTRRSQTEGRIGIFKNVFLAKTLKSQILENKRHTINWCVLTHNLWVLSRMALADERQKSPIAA